MSLDSFAISEISEGQDFEVKKAAGRSGKGAVPETFFETYSPLTDYLQFGSSYYYSNKRKVLAEAAEKRKAYQTNFRINYVAQINQAVAVVGGLSSTQSPKEAMIIILKTIVGVVRQYHNWEEGAKINANCMVAYPVANPPTDLQNRLRFARPAGTFSHYLAIQEYAFPEGKENFILPVEDINQGGWQKFILIGAPRVFAQSAQLELVDDTRRAKFPHGFPKDIKKLVEAYFGSKHFRSFASLSIIHDARAVGVLSIETDSTYIFGKSELTKKEVRELVEPLASLLGFIIKT